MALSITGVGCISKIASLQPVKLLDPGRPQFHPTISSVQQNSFAEIVEQTSHTYVTYYCQQDAANPLTLEEQKAEFEHEMNVGRQRLKFQEKKNYKG